MIVLLGARTVLGTAGTLVAAMTTVAEPQLASSDPEPDIAGTSAGVPTFPGRRTVPISVQGA